MSPCFADKPAVELKPLPGKPEAEQFADVPAPWRDYLRAARKAEALPGRLARCLAYPDLPGNRWPAGHAQAHCRYHTAEVIDLEGIDAHLQRRDVAGLEARMAAYLARHFSKTDAGEDIHLVFEQFNVANDGTDGISARWLELAPRSAYASLARGTYLRAAAWEARGTKWASETPDEDMREMKRLMAQAIPLHEQALRIEPRLMPAYAGLLNVVRDGAPAGLEQAIIERAARHDPACVEVARQRMISLQPRWGGSYEDMLAYAAQLSRHVASRPQLAMHVAAPYGERGNRMLIDNEFTREAMDILDIAVRTGSNEPHLNDAAELATKLPPEAGGPDRWKALALFLQESRFNHVSAWTNREIARLLVRLEPEWSVRHAMRALEDSPDHPYGHYILAAGLNNTGQFAAAEHHYAIAAEDAGNRRQALLEVTGMLLHRAMPDDRKEGARRAGPYLDRLLQEHPEHGKAWLYRIDQHIALNDGRLEMALVRNFLVHADRNDPVQADEAERFEAVLDQAIKARDSAKP